MVKLRRSNQRCLLHAKACLQRLDSSRREMRRGWTQQLSVYSMLWPYAELLGSKDLTAFNPGLWIILRREHGHHSVCCRRADSQLKMQEVSGDSEWLVGGTGPEEQLMHRHLQKGSLMTALDQVRSAARNLSAVTTCTISSLCCQLHFFSKCSQAPWVRNLVSCSVLIQMFLSCVPSPMLPSFTMSQG